MQALYELAREPKTIRFEDRGHGFLRDAEWMVSARLATREREVKRIEAGLGMALLVASTLHADQWLEEPVDDATYQTYLEFFDVDDSLPF